MNYQEALDTVNSSILNCSTCDTHGCKRNSTCSELLEYKNAIDTLQKLIDNYTKFNEDKSCQYICDTKALLEEELSIVKERLLLTEKALDEAVEIFNFHEMCPSVRYCPNLQEHKCNCDECWKDYLLKEGNNND